MTGTTRAFAKTLVRTVTAPTLVMKFARTETGWTVIGRTGIDRTLDMNEIEVGMPQAVVVEGAWDQASLAVDGQRKLLGGAKEEHLWRVDR